jgi:dihydrofolate reductase
MPTGHSCMAMSLDGFVARTDHRLDWLIKQRTDGEDHGFFSFMAGVDGLVMGSGSFRTAIGFDKWPYDKPVIVLSHTLTEADIPPPIFRAKSISQARLRKS